MSAENRIDYIEMPARDPARAKAFFTELCGWTFEDYGPDYCAFNDGRMAGGFFRADQHGSAEAGGPLLVIYRADLAVAEQRVTELGGTVTKPVYAFPGGKRFHFRDPNDNEFAVWSDQ